MLNTHCSTGCKYIHTGHRRRHRILLPKTALEVNIIATRISYQPGELCQYANRYLRMNNVNPQPETYWEIKQIDVRSIGVPDSTKAYIIKLKDKVPYQILS